MSESEALRAARKGQAVLEAFQRSRADGVLDFSGVDFRIPENEHINFSGFTFRKKVSFERSIFGDTPVTFQVYGYPANRGSPKGAALFQNTVFHRDAQFSGATFGNDARFDGATFNDIVNFVGTTFGNTARFSRAVFQASSFASSTFGPRLWFDDVLMVRDCSFEESIFGFGANFERTYFERAHFQCSLFGDAASFESAVFSALAQFNNTEFGEGANFQGVAFCTRAGFEGAAFGDVASFRGADRQLLVDMADERAKSLSPDHAKIVKDRARLADPSAFLRVSFSGAIFTSEGPRYGNVFSQAKGMKSRIIVGSKELARSVRVLFYPPHDLMRERFAGADFSNRTIRGHANFSRVRFDQPPDFENVEPATSLDLAGARFSFGRSAWPLSRYWTTKTDTVNRLRRLRKIMKDIEEVDLEQSLFVLQRMAERGVAWRLWWDDVLQGWGIYHLINARLKDGRKVEFSDLKRRRSLKLARSIWVTITGIGRPLMLTFLVFLYRYSSNFGRSIIFPAGWFILFLCGFAYLYSFYTTTGCCADQVSDLIAFSFSVSFPISPLARLSFNEIALRLFPNGIPTGVFMISVGQTIIESLLLFLVALALRNHFRVR